MDNLVDSLSIILSLVSLFLIPVAVLTVIYLIKRNGFYISVNCWFCNSWTKVLYTDRNSFCCPFCLQYNGFNEDGGYNTVIEAQFDTSFNPDYNRNNEKTTSLTNGLCAYCNNNQQLKVRQLADFVPLNERNYDVEVEHFRAQLDRSYRLCKKCDRVLRKTIDRQHAWIFGNRIKNSQKKGSYLLNSNKSKAFNISMKSIIMNLIRFCLVLCLLVIFCQLLNAKIHHSKKTVKEYFPDIVPYTVLLNDWCHIVTNYKDKFIKNISHKLNLHDLSAFNNTWIMKNDILPIAGVGLIFETILFIWLPKAVMWKINELLGWIILITTSLNTIHDDYFVYINGVQIFCCVAIMCGLLTGKQGNKTAPKKKFTFKRLKASKVKADSSDEEVFEEASGTSFSSKNSLSEKSFRSSYLNASGCPLHPQNFLFQDVLQNTANSNDTFLTARSTKSSSVFNTSLKNNSIHGSSHELHHSLDNLHLSNLSFKPRLCNSPVFSVNSINRPILSPPKLKNITQNSWTAGGFWKNDVAAYPVATDFANLSRSSSQSSGFVSSSDPVVANAYNSLPASRDPSLCGDLEKTSLLSEPAYHFKPINSSNRNNFSFNNLQAPKQTLPKTGSLLYYKADNTFYPVLRHDRMLFIQGSDVPRLTFESRLSSLPRGCVNTNGNRFSSPMFGEKPVISSLFKNIQGLGTQPYTFKAPH